MDQACPRTQDPKNIFTGLSGFDHKRPLKTGVLLVNLGTPDQPTASALRRYLREFLSDPRVIELPKLQWALILNLFVLPFRPKKSAELYKKVWTSEGSPLLLITKQQTEKLRRELSETFGDNLVVDFAMRYGNPSVKSVLDRFQQQGVTKLLVIPLYPQYASATTGSTFDAVSDALKTWRWVPELKFITEYHDHPLYIEALASSIKDLWTSSGIRPNKLLFSFHGIPKRYFLGGDPYYCHCQKTARLVAEHLGLARENYVVSFQSLFGKEEWIKPYTDQTLKEWAKQGIKSVDVICPGFFADCLETLEEIDGLNRELFLHEGGKEYRYISCLNDTPGAIATLRAICERELHRTKRGPELILADAKVNSGP